MKEKRNKEEKREISKLWITGTIAFALLLGIILISALTIEEKNALQNELNLLESELSNNGYGWLVNYSEINLNKRMDVK